MPTFQAPFAGDGRDGTKIITGSEDPSPIKTSISGTVSAGTTSINVSSSAGFSEGDFILLHQTRGNPSGNHGKYEIRRVSSTSSGVINVTRGLTNTYQDDGGSNPNQAQVIRIPQYRFFKINAGASGVSSAWAGDTGGIIVLMSPKIEIVGNLLSVGADSVESNPDTSGAGTGAGGFRGGWNSRDSSPAGRGESNLTSFGYVSEGHTADGTGGGGARGTDGGVNSGAGGGHATAGGNGSNGAVGGGTVGDAAMSIMSFGGGGGGARNDVVPCSGGGAGGGIIYLIFEELTVSGQISVNGGNGVGSGNDRCGGGGAGGSILLRGIRANIGTNLVRANGGDGQFNAGDGGQGRIRIEVAKLIGSTNQGSVSTAVLRHDWTLGDPSMLS